MSIKLLIDSEIEVKKKNKIVRATGGCLGVKRRGRTWQAAISFGEPSNRL